ncbi:MAG: hypothetical protein HKL82_04920 [Acidimicrobiaceae bacterium]|nr:hypothetical protein [Acidimicrobiaceae bacterium]
MATDGVIDDHVLSRYRELLDAEDAAFNEVEHAYEDGDRAHFQADLAIWRKAIDAKIAYLERCGLSLLGPDWGESLPKLRESMTSSRS